MRLNDSNRDCSDGLNACIVPQSLTDIRKDTFHHFTYFFVNVAGSFRGSMMFMWKHVFVYISKLKEEISLDLRTGVNL